MKFSHNTSNVCSTVPFFSFSNESRTTTYALLSNYSAQWDVFRLLSRQITVFKSQRVTKTVQNPQGQEKNLLLIGAINKQTGININKRTMVYIWYQLFFILPYLYCKKTSGANMLAPKKSIVVPQNWEMTLSHRNEK